MIVDGKAIAETIYQKIQHAALALAQKPHLTVFTCAPHFETVKYLNLKRKRAEMLGIEFCLVEFQKDCTTEEVIKSIRACKGETDAVVVQLPLPPHIKRDEVLSHIPLEKDVDALNPKTTGFLSPVVGAIATILETYGITPHNKNVAILGSGALVGAPAARWFTSQGATVDVVTKNTADIRSHTQNADIIVSGVGIPGLIKPEMLKKGVVLLDAGTSEEGGELRGDADPACTMKCSLFTPVPGGIGPITVAMLLRNVVDSAKRSQSVL